MKYRRSYEPRIVGGKVVMMPADLQRLHQYLLNIGRDRRLTGFQVGHLALSRSPMAASRASVTILAWSKV